MGATQAEARRPTASRHRHVRALPFCVGRALASWSAGGRHGGSVQAARDRTVHGSGTVLLTLGGLIAAFGVASCCGLPFLLATLELGTAWRGAVACTPGAICARPAVRRITMLSLRVGFVLLYLGYIYA